MSDTKFLLDRESANFVSTRLDMPREFLKTPHTEEQWRKSITNQFREKAAGISGGQAEEVRALAPGASLAKDTSGQVNSLSVSTKEVLDTLQAQEKKAAQKEKEKQEDFERKEKEKLSNHDKPPSDDTELTPTQRLLQEKKEELAKLQKKIEEDEKKTTRKNLLKLLPSPNASYTISSSPFISVLVWIFMADGPLKDIIEDHLFDLFQAINPLSRETFKNVLEKMKQDTFDYLDINPEAKKLADDLTREIRAMEKSCAEEEKIKERKYNPTAHIKPITGEDLLSQKGEIEKLMQDTEQTAGKLKAHEGLCDHLIKNSDEPDILQGILNNNSTVDAAIGLDADQASDLTEKNPQSVSVRIGNK